MVVGNLQEVEAAKNVTTAAVDKVQALAVAKEVPRYVEWLQSYLGTTVQEPLSLVVVPGNLTSTPSEGLAIVGSDSTIDVI